MDGLDRALPWRTDQFHQQDLYLSLQFQSDRQEQDFQLFSGNARGLFGKWKCLCCGQVTKDREPFKIYPGGDIAADCFTVDDADKDDYSQDPAFGVSPASFHRGRVNILFADGSVRAYEKFNSSEMQVTYSGTGTY